MELPAKQQDLYDADYLQWIETTVETLRSLIFAPMPTLFAVTYCKQCDRSLINTEAKSINA